MPAQFTLGKTERLKSRKAIEQLFKQGKSFVVSPFRVYYVIKKPAAGIPYSLPNIQFGAGASTKNFKKAVDRNRIKRLTREAWRLQKKSVQEILKEKKLQLDVFFIYTAKELPLYKDVYATVTKISDKLHHIISPDN